MNDSRKFLMNATDRSGPGFSIGRRKLLAYAVASPVVMIAAGFGVNLATPASALAMRLVKLLVGTAGKVTLEMPRLDQGQGIATALRMVIAEEMAVPLGDVSLRSAEAQRELRYDQVIGVLPVIAAAARARLLAYAAQHWSLAPSSLRVEAGVVIAPDGRSAPYGSLMIAFAVSSVTISSTKRTGWICTERYETVFQSNGTEAS
jgi:isoquinoline 1-oxidoreductase beta subunit